jgi:hypothetical protein
MAQLSLSSFSELCVTFAVNSLLDAEWSFAMRSIIRLLLLRVCLRAMLPAVTLAVGLLFTTGSAYAQEAAVTGTVTYLERMALPPARSSQFHWRMCRAPTPRLR